ncbi:MAG TPA: PadR family transcriptional regulator [Pyrinomonadaceae bacterium]|nr:PadR family transcriptional regulator [Pyrinomonadaceae bacterium]
MRETKSKYAVLGMLSIAPMSGYDIKKRVEESISNFWTESYGQIYPILKSLVAEKLVTKTVERGAGKPDRHVYALTDQGREELQRWLAEGVTPKVERNELLLKLFFGEEVSFDINVGHIEGFRELQRGLLEKYKAIEKEIKAEYADNSNLPYWLLTVSYGQHVSRALLDWCDEALLKLNKTAKSRKK